jgi:hypothetical protein
MELTYCLTREDHQQFYKFAQQRVASHAKGPLGWKGATILFFVASTLLSLLVLDYFFRNHVIDERAFGAACLAYGWALISVVLCGWFWRRQFWINWLPDDSVSLSEMRLKLDSDGIEGSDQTKVTKYSWRAFSDISEHGRSVVMWIDRGQGILVPASALADEETRRNFVSLARAHITPA